MKEVAYSKEKEHRKWVEGAGMRFLRLMEEERGRKN